MLLEDVLRAAKHLNMYLKHLSSINYFRANFRPKRVLICHIMTDLETGLLREEKYDYTCIRLVGLTVIVSLGFVFIIYCAIHFWR